MDELASWLDNHWIDEKVFQMESQDFSVHWVETLYATCWSFAGVFFKFAGSKITNYDNILMAKGLYSKENICRNWARMCAAELWAKVCFLERHKTF